MNRFLLLILVAGIAFLVVLFANRPELIEDIWLWLIGLIGAIIRVFQLIADYLKKLFRDGFKQQNVSNNSNEISENEHYAGSTLKLLRISNKGDSTIGNLFVNDSFYCYTMEDSFQEIKIPGKTRIPNGVYDVSFNKKNTPLTEKFRQSNPDWFTYHLEVKMVPDFNSIYIHNGGTHEYTEGCILVSDSLQVNDQESYLTNSKSTFKRLYLFLSQQLNNSIPVRLIVKDEDWIKNLNSK